MEDVTDAFLTVMEQGVLGEIYNIGTDFEIPVIKLARELVRMVCIFLLDSMLEMNVDFFSLA